jgi:hypothetical protein
MSDKVLFDHKFDGTAEDRVDAIERLNAIYVALGVSAEHPPPNARVVITESTTDGAVNIWITFRKA